ncbi:hypothetical protein P3T27_000096 [Kitasatospora sp. MAA19]|uniref:hypothetical protein n=1 Tax=Kitasatospora sp. MAA19 TaxID=3035090 RepID=UPI002474305D|nr:hypothetical protein [Kitasatospora sp. MAA19]MDH6703415.1 hypothetical protein [Kitasatospora sp. MAA19]
MADGAGQRPSGGEDDGFSAEERAVRELMRHAVADIQPEPGGLPRIRHAVPRRRAVRRGAWTGAAALALAVAVALPALHDGEHLGLSGGPGSADATSPSVATPTGTRTGGSTGTGTPSRPGPSGTGDTASPSAPATASPSPGTSTTRPDGTPAAPVPAASTGDSAIVPLCTRADLGQGGAQVGPADADGRIYGSFTVVNVSGHGCRLGGPGAVAVTVVSGTDRSLVRTADHTAGDPADALPAMDADPPVLAPQAGYRVPFAWIPDRTCPTSGGGGAATTAAPTGQGGAKSAAAGSQAPAASGAAPATDASAAPSGGPQPSSSPSAGPTTGTSPTATPTANPSTRPATATIAHTPAPGSPAVATATLPITCAGTLYRGGVQPVGATAPQPSGSPSAG